MQNFVHCYSNPLQLVRSVFKLKDAGCVNGQIVLSYQRIAKGGRIVLKNLLSAVGSYASLFGLYYSVRPSSPFTTVEQFLLTVSIILVAIHVALDIAAYYKTLPKSLRSDADIKQYMERFTQGWKDGGGRTSILARDMSWVDDETEELLCKLARFQNLTLFMEGPNEFAAKLHSQGAEVIFYSNSGLTPATRFAVTNEGRADAQVVIGFKNSKGHLQIEEYRREHMIFHLCSDIVRLLRAANRINVRLG